LQASRQGNRVRYPAGFTDYLEVRLGFQHGPQTPAKYGVLVGENQAQARALISKSSCVYFLDAWHQSDPTIVPR
jgi:hypothetical protein